MFKQDPDWIVIYKCDSSLPHWAPLDPKATITETSPLNIFFLNKSSTFHGPNLHINEKNIVLLASIEIYGRFKYGQRVSVIMPGENTQTVLVFNTDFILSIEKASKLWLQICGWSRGGLSSAVSWSADSLRAYWAGDAELWSSWVSDPGACTSYPERD